MYDEQSLVEKFEELKLAARPRSPFDSAIEDIREIEIEGRTYEAVIVEGVKTS